MESISHFSSDFDINQCIVVDIGNSYSKCMVMRGFKVFNLTYRDGDSNWRSCVDVSENGLRFVDMHYGFIRNHVILKNTKHLLGKTRNDLREEYLNSERYGADVLFDEQEMPYFHCLVNDHDNNGNPVYRDVYPEEVFGVILGEMKEQAHRIIEREISSCCFTIPFHASDRTRQLLLSEVSKQGLDCVCMITEPMATYYYLRSKCDSLTDGELIMIVNAGSSSFDISIIHHNHNNPQLIVHNSLRELIFDEMMNHLMNYVINEYEREKGTPLLDPSNPRRYSRNLNKLYQRCEEAIQNFSVGYIVDIDLVGFVDDDYDDYYITISRYTFEDIIQPITSRIDGFWKETLRNANIPQNYICHVLLTGGISRIPIIRELFQSFYMVDNIDPDACIASGALSYLSTHSTN